MLRSSLECRANDTNDTTDPECCKTAISVVDPCTERESREISERVRIGKRAENGTGGRVVVISPLWQTLEAV